MQEVFNIHKSISVIEHINELKNEKHMISIDGEKAFDTIHHKCIINNLHNRGEEGTNLINATYENPTANIILNGKELKSFPLRSRTVQGCLLSPFLFNTV